MRTVPKLTDGGSAKTLRLPHLEVRLPLTLMTPIIGGGVKALTPDREVPVRPTAIRGALRWWWRVLSPIEELNDLRLAEARIFGGVNLPVKKGEPDTLSSRLSVRVENVANLRKVPAGFHRTVKGLPKSMPNWKLARGLDYALFPLQASLKERERWSSDADMPTKEVINQLDFDLVLRIEQRVKLTEVAADVRAFVSVPGPSDADVQSLLLAVRWWLNFGGVGGRTRRGFGAVRLREAATVKIAGNINSIAESLGNRPTLAMLPKPPDKDKLPTNRPSLYNARLFIGPKQADEHEAHGMAVGLLWDFRQAPDLARDPGVADPGTPGRSRWPEPDLVKQIAGRQPYKHVPHSHGNETLAAPRAAFGLPILIRFKDRGDDLANADLLPTLDATGNKKSERWASPLIVRPVILQQGGYAPAALVLGGYAIPKFVVVKLEQAGKHQPNNSSATKRVVKGFAGSRTTIAAVLKPHGNALYAFCDWIVNEYEYTKEGGE